MANNFQYTVQAEGQAYKEAVLTGADIHNSWHVFHKNPDEKGLWTLSTEGYLQITSNQNGLSGRYDPNALDATDYAFVTEVIPSGADDDSFGIHFRYQDNFHFYFVAWDGGGEYGWGTETLRLYKVNGDTYELLASSPALGTWVGGTPYQFEIEARGNLIVVTVDGQERMRLEDTDNPYLKGAYGPCATSQVSTWTYLSVLGAQSFMVSENFDSSVTIDNYSYETGTRISDVDVYNMMKPHMDAYLTNNGYDVTTGNLSAYSISTADTSVEVFFNASSPSKTTTSGTEFPMAYLKYDENPPSAPTNLSGTVEGTSITWAWSDTSNFEDGFEILDANGFVIAVVGSDVTQWSEHGLEVGTQYTRQVRAYNRYGSSETISASAVTEKIEIIESPNAPTSLRGVTNSTTQITWYWEPVSNTDVYELYAKDGTLLTTQTGTKFQESGLTPDTAYERYVVARNLAGYSGPSNMALAFTDVIPVEGPVPNVPLNFAGEAIDATTILWTWEPPLIEVSSTYPDGTTKTEEEIEAEKEEALSKLSYRVYDMNGEVLYEVPPGVYEFYERELLPDTPYTHYVKAFDLYGESTRSNYAYARTDTYVMESVDEEEEIKWPIEKECTPVDKEPSEKLEAFHSGIGDNLDLKVRVNKKGVPREQFTYDLQLKGYEYVPIEIFPAQPLKFRFKSEGIEKVIVYTADYIANLTAFPEKKYSYKVDGQVEVPAGFSYKVEADAQISQIQQSPLPYNWTPFASVAYKKLTNVTTASMFQDDSTKSVYGANTWTYDASTDTVKGDLNSNWSGAYNKNHIGFENYSFDCQIAVDDISNTDADNDVIGVAFRINYGADGKRRMYYFVSDRADSSGQGVGSVWRLGKTKDQATNSWTWPFGGVELFNTNITGWVRNQWYDVRVQVTGPRIMIWLDGTLVIDIVDDDPEMVKGAFGPTNSSQRYFSARNFTMDTVELETVYGDTTSDDITDVNDSTNKKVLTTDTTSVIMDPFIQTAYNNYTAQAGNESAILEVQQYGVQDSRTEVITETAVDGTSNITAYTTANTSVLVHYPITIESDSFTDTITENHADAATSKSLTQTLSVTKQHTASEIMTPKVEEYKTTNGISDSEMSIQSYRAITLTPETTVTTLQDGTDVIKAYTTEGTIYTGEKTYSGTVYEYDGWFIQSEAASILTLRNKYAEVYTGASSKVTYTLTDLLGDANVLPVWESTEVTGSRVGSDRHKVKTTEKVTKELSGFIDGLNPRFYFVDDLITLPATEEYKNAHFFLQKTGVHDNAWLAFRSNRENKTYGEVIKSIKRDEVVIISADEREVIKPWISYSEWYDGIVNGNEPFRKDGDGKKDLRVPIEVNVPDSVTIDAWYVEMDDPNGTITAVIENGIGNKTTLKNDVVVFSSEAKGPDIAELVWYGPKISGETIYEVKEGEVLTIKDKFLSPYRDALLSSKNITQWKLIITSKNPNVRVWEADEQEPWDEENLFQDVELLAKLINPTQTAWSPLIHNGFYYFNQKEYFLYSDTKVKGKYTQADGFQDVEFSYTVKAHCERITDAGIQRWIDTNRADFKGIANMIDLDASLGDLVLAKNMSDTYETMGMYTSEEKIFNGDVVEEWDTVQWIATTPFDSSVIVETSTLEGGVWSSWLPIENGDLIASPLSDKFKYRVTLNVGKEKFPTAFTHEVDINSEFNQGEHTNTQAINDHLQMVSVEQEKSSWLSKVFDLGENIDSLGTITYMPVLQGTIGEKIEVYTVTADTETGPWDGTGEPLAPLSNMTINADGTKTGTIASVTKRYLRYQVRLVRGREDSLLTATLTNGSDFSAGKLTNLAVKSSTFELSDVNKDGVFVSDALDLGHVTAFRTLTLDAIIPELGAATVSTISSASILGFETLEADETNWLPLNADGTIASSPARYLKVRVILKAGETARTIKAILQDAKEDFTGSINSNIEITSDGKIALSNPQYNGYYESEPLDFRTLDSWIAVNHVAELNGGTVKVLTQTSSSSIGPWSAWQELGASNSIVSPIDNYIRYRVEMTPTEGETTVMYHDDTDVKFQTDAIASNAVYTATGTGIRHNDPELAMTFQSGIKELTDVKDFLRFLNTQTLATDAVIKIYTKTSTDKSNWSAWDALNADGTIASPDRQYLRYYIEVSEGYGPKQLGTKVHTQATEFQAGVMDNVHVNVDALELINAGVGNFYSPVFDFKGRVSSWDDVSLTSVLPILDGGIRVFTISSNIASDIAYSDLATAQAQTWVEATYDTTTGSYMIGSTPARYLRYRLELTSGYTAIRQDNWTEDTTAEWNTNNGANNVDWSTDTIKLTDPTLTGSFASVTKDWVASYDKWEATNAFSMVVQGADNGGDAELLIKTAADSANLSAAPEISLGLIQSGTLSGTIPATVERYMSYIVRLAPGISSPINTGVQEDHTTFAITTDDVNVKLDASSFVVLDDVEIEDTTPPGEVTNLVATNITDTTVDLSWTNPSDTDFTHVNIYESDGTTLVAGPVTDPFLHVYLLVPETSYNWLVKTVDSDGNESAGVSVSFTTTADSTAPDEVVNLSGSATTDTISLSWENPTNSDFSHVNLYYNDGTVIATNVTGTTYDITGLASDTSYTIVVKTVDTTGNESTGVSVTVTTSAMTMATLGSEPNVGTWTGQEMTVEHFHSWNNMQWTFGGDTSKITLHTNVKGTDGVWEGWKPVDMATGAITSRATDVKGIQVKAEFTSYKSQGIWQSPILEMYAVFYNTTPPMTPEVSSVTFTSDVRDHSSPEVRGIEAATTADGFEPFMASEVSDVSIEYKQKTFTSPLVDSVEVSGNVYNRTSPVVDAIHVNADVYYWRTPKVDRINLASNLYNVKLHTPTLHEISFGAKLPAQIVEEEYGVSLMGTVSSDQSTHRVSDKTMKTIIDNHMAEFGVNQSNLYRRRYSLASSVPGIFVETKENNASVYYENGESEVYAYTTDTAMETIYSQAKVVVDTNDEALVTPIPQQGAPIIVKDESGKELRHVTFLDEDGRLTLTNTEEFEADGKREFTLSYHDIDLDTLEIWVDEMGMNQYTKVVDYLVCNNEITTKITYPKGTPIRVAYRLLNSYCVDYNYDVEEDYAMIKLHRPVLNESREITVRYETNLETAYYSASEINLNPMQNLYNEGFLYISDETRPAKKLEVHFNPNTLHANGYDRTTITVIAKDEYGNPVVGDIINFFVTDGSIVINQALTDENGMAIATYTAPTIASNVELTVIDRTSRIESKNLIYIRKPMAKPRITLNVSKSVIAPDNKDTVKITARVVGDSQQPAIDAFVLFETLEGTMLNSTDKTNYIGEAYARVKTNIQPSDDILTVKVSVPELGLAEYVNIRVSEVAPIA